MKSRLTKAVAIAMLLAITVPAWADPPFGKGRHRSADRYDTALDVMDMLLTEYHRYKIRQILTDRRADGINYGAIQDNRNLPPGMINRLRQGKPLPPGIAKKATYFPDAVRYDLGIRNPHYRLGVAGRDVFVMNAMTGIVLDVLRNVLD